jgi:HSP20 family protein
MADLVPVTRGSRAPARTESAQPPTLPDAYWSPFREFDEVWDRMVRRFFGEPAWPVWTQGWTPPVDVEETDDAWIFEIELPGAQRDDLQVDVTDAELSISGEVKEKERAGVLRQRSRRVGSFRYRTTLPSGVDAGKVTARFENGLLTVRVPRPEQAKARHIRID